MNSNVYMHDIKSIELSDVETGELSVDGKRTYYTRTFKIIGEDSKFEICIFSHNEEHLKLKGE